MTALVLARAQFAFTVSFHFLLPAFSIGLASFLAVLEALWLRTGSGVYANLYRYWLKVFAVVFAMGVVSGIVMSYQFGTNWAVFSDKAGPVIGPLMAYEVLTAFFLEAGLAHSRCRQNDRTGHGVEPHRLDSILGIVDRRVAKSVDPAGIFQLVGILAEYGSCAVGEGRIHKHR
jgi:Cytochrome bd terminal oxidase subunit I